MCLSSEPTIPVRCAVFLLCAIGCGCTWSPRGLPELAEDGAQVIIAAGHFESAILRRISDCGLTLEQAEIIDCWPPLVRSRATFVADEVFQGPAKPRRIEVQFLLSAERPVFETSSGARYLVVIKTDGRYSLLGGYAQLGRILPQGWAVPLTDFENFVPLPCGRDPPDPELIEFASPAPRAEISGLGLDREYLRELAEDGLLRIRGRYIYWKQGVTLQAAVAHYMSKGPALFQSCG